jgi:hypothetical protein
MLEEKSFCPAFGRSDWPAGEPMREDLRSGNNPACPGQFCTPVDGQPWKPVDTAEYRCAGSEALRHERCGALEHFLGGGFAEVIAVSDKERVSHGRRLQMKLTTALPHGARSRRVKRPWNKWRGPALRGEAAVYAAKALDRRPRRAKVFRRQLRRWRRDGLPIGGKSKRATRRRSAQRSGRAARAEDCVYQTLDGGAATPPR